MTPTERRAFESKMVERHKTLKENNLLIQAFSKQRSSMALNKFNKHKSVSFLKNFINTDSKR